MDKSAFREHYNLSRGQLDRMLAKAAKNSGVFEVQDFGTFRVVKGGDRKTDPIDILPVKKAESATPLQDEPERETGTAEPSGLEFASPDSAIPPPRVLRRLSKAQLERYKDIATIEKTRQACESEHRKIREEVLAELVSSVAIAFSELRWAIDELRLPSDQLDRLRAALDASLNSLQGVRLEA